MIRRIIADHGTTYARYLVVAVVIAASAITAGCLTGYSAGELYPENVRTVYLPIFANRSFYRETEFRLTEALVKEIESRTPYKVVSSGAADTELTGTILAVNKRLLSRAFEGGVPQELQVTIVADFQWKDLRTGQLIRKRSRIEGTGQYVPTHPVSEPFEVAQHEAVALLSSEIVSVMRSDW